MDIDAVVQLADHLMWSQRKKHLSDLQKAIIKDVCLGKDYREIGEKIGKSEDHVRNTASKLWQVLSDILEEKVTKFNLRNTLERQIIILSKSLQNNYIANGDLNICNTRQTPQQNNHTILNKLEKDLTQAPNVKQFYGRNQEIETLENIVNNSRLITVFGLIGVGKSSLVRHFIDLNIVDFNSIIWLNLQLKPSLDNILNQLLLFLVSEIPLHDTIDNKLARLVEILQEKRCLIIFDNGHYLYQKGELSGQYLKGYDCYGDLIKLIAETSHQSCLILISQEKPKEITYLESKNLPVAVMELQGLGNDAKLILDNLGLPDQKNWSFLIQLYQGNPLFLGYFAKMIQELGMADLTDIIQDNSLLITEELEDSFREIWSRLSDKEKSILIALTKSNKYVNIQRIKELVNCPTKDLVNTVRSLLRRCLINTEETTELTYSVSPLIAKLISNL